MFGCDITLVFFVLFVQGLGRREGDIVTNSQYLDQTTANVDGIVSVDTIQPTSLLDGNLEYYSPAPAFVHNFIVITINQ